MSSGISLLRSVSCINIQELEKHTMGNEGTLSPLNPEHEQNIDGHSQSF